MQPHRQQSPAPNFNRRRSNTGLPPPRLNVGDKRVLELWATEDSVSTGNSNIVTFNHALWPGIVEGDTVQVVKDEDSDRRCLFVVLREEALAKQHYRAQISIPKALADVCGWRNNDYVTLTKVDPTAYHASYVELTFKDQYLGRNEMWRMGKQLVGQCIHLNQELHFASLPTTAVQSIHLATTGILLVPATAGIVTSTTKFVFRSLSSKVTMFIQVCRELFEFSSSSGARPLETIIHSFLPGLLHKWKEAGTNHTITIVLISRVFYDADDDRIYAGGPLRVDEEKRWYKDFYKVITDLEVMPDWSRTLVSLKRSFWDFQRDILLTHHYHRPVGAGPTPQARLVGKLSCAHDGPILEALNLVLKPNETHYIDRSLSVTAASTILITPGTGYFRVSKRLLRLTTTRILDQGFGLDLISLSQAPLHLSPIFSFKGYEPDAHKPERGGRVNDPLWGGDLSERERVGKELQTFWWEPFWISISFWDQEIDLPVRQDRFVARAKMPDIQMMGLLDHDVLSNIAIPFLPAEGANPDPYATPIRETFEKEPLPKADADRFDRDTFKLSRVSGDRKLVNRGSFASFLSGASAGSGTILASSLKSNSFPDRRSIGSISDRRSHRNSLIAAPITPIEESPRPVPTELPQPEQVRRLISESSSSSSPPSPPGKASSIRSENSNGSTETKVGSSAKSFLPTKFNTTWLFNRFKSQPSEPQTSNVSTLARTAIQSTEPQSLSQTSSPHIAPSPLPMPIKNSASQTRSTYGRMSSPRNTPPREDFHAAKRRNTAATYGTSTSSQPSGSGSNVNTSARTNPSRMKSTLSASQLALAKRWQHMVPLPLFKHQIKWKSMVTPGCLPLTVDYLPTAKELAQYYDMFPYDFVVDPNEMRTFLVRPPDGATANLDTYTKSWALSIMRGMAAVRLVQGFQLVLGDATATEVTTKIKRKRIINNEVNLRPIALGASQILESTEHPVYLSTSNEVHRIAYVDGTIQVRRYVRRMPPSQPYSYEYLIWAKLGEGYTQVDTAFTSYGVEDYRWNSLDMMVAGYEHQLSFSESLRYWRTRFIVIPTSEPPQHDLLPEGDKDRFSDEEIRMLGIEKLADMFTKLRWQGDVQASSSSMVPPVRFIPTTLRPAFAVQDPNILTQLDDMHAAGSLKKKPNSSREITDMRNIDIVKAMREEDGVPFKNYQWNTSCYPDSFTGADLVSWLVREFGDVSSRHQGAEWGSKLLDRGLFVHCRGTHRFLDGVYFYKLIGDYALPPQTPSSRRWFNARNEPVRQSGISTLVKSSSISGREGSRPSSSHRRNPRKRLILSQSLILDIDPNKKSDQAESVILHHDIVHNPHTVFHFELQWIGTTARVIEDRLRSWTNGIENYGLRLVEAYVSQISDIRQRNSFQSCFPIKLAAIPPIIPDFASRVPEGVPTKHYFEHLILSRFGFILDVEAADAFSDQIDVVYSYIRSRVAYSQYVHRSGVAFVQVIGDEAGFLFLTNRLMGPARMGSSKDKHFNPAAEAQSIRNALNEFCGDEEQINQFYQDEIAKLLKLPEEPDELSLGEPLLDVQTVELPLPTF